jgi:hypothetical protein
MVARGQIDQVLLKLVARSGARSPVNPRRRMAGYHLIWDFRNRVGARRSFPRRRHDAWLHPLTSGSGLSANGVPLLHGTRPVDRAGQRCRARLPSRVRRGCLCSRFFAEHVRSGDRPAAAVGVDFAIVRAAVNANARQHAMVVWTARSPARPTGRRPACESACWPRVQGGNRRPARLPRRRGRRRTDRVRPVCPGRRRAPGQSGPAGRGWAYLAAKDVLPWWCSANGQGFASSSGQGSPMSANRQSSRHADPTRGYWPAPGLPTPAFATSVTSP